VIRRKAIPDRRPSIVGTWRITSTELWDRDALDLTDEAFVRFGPDQLGELPLVRQPQRVSVLASSGVQVALSLASV
jgi:hypothetical protein